MAVKIRLKRMGKIRAPFYRVVVMDSRTKRDGRAIEEIGKYHPTREPSLIQIDSERALYWLGVGAQPTEQVMALLKVTGDWQKHKGLPGAEGTLKVAPPPPDRKALYEAAMAAAGKADEDHARGGGQRRRPAKAEAAAGGESAAQTEAGSQDPAPVSPAEPAPVEPEADRTEPEASASEAAATEPAEPTDSGERP